MISMGKLQVYTPEPSPLATFIFPLSLLFFFPLLRFRSPVLFSASSLPLSFSYSHLSFPLFSLLFFPLSLSLHTFLSFPPFSLLYLPLPLTPSPSQLSQLSFPTEYQEATRCFLDSYGRQKKKEHTWRLTTHGKIQAHAHTGGPTCDSPVFSACQEFADRLFTRSPFNQSLLAGQH